MDFETTSPNGSQLLQQLKSTLAQYAPDYAQESQQYEQAKDMFYTVEPELLAEVLGIAVDYQMLSLDGSILSVTSPDEQMVTVFYDNEECYYYLDGYTVLVDCRLRDSEKLVGRKNYTLAHEIAHQVLYKAFPNAYHSANWLTCDYRRTRNSHKKISNWVEWQADALAAALLMPKDAILDVMFLTGLGEHIGTLSKKYTPNKYESFCRLAETLGASKSALSFRMEQLGLLERNLLYKQLQRSKDVWNLPVNRKCALP